MDDNGKNPSMNETTPAVQEELAAPKSSGRTTWVFILAILLVLAVVIAAAYFLINQDTQTVGQIRDIFIIFMALESLVIGVALIILITQLAILINLLQNEIKPIVHSTNETVNTLRGTAIFLSDNLTEPVIKLNQYLAGIKRLLELVRPGRS
jgi:ABC-type sulfate transport system permease component